MVSRREFISGSASAFVGLAAGAGSVKIYGESASDDPTSSRMLTPIGKHQAGIESEPHGFVNFVSLNLDPKTSTKSMRHWMSLLTDDIIRLASGNAVLADPQPQLIESPSRFSCTVGFGLSLFEKLGLEDRLPENAKPIPKFKIDRLSDSYSGGDVLLQIQCDERLMLGHATRGLLRDSSDFASVKFIMHGYNRIPSPHEEHGKPRNLMGQIDGTDNPEILSQDFADRVWIDSGPEWLIGGTQMVLRRIEMNLPSWDTLSTTQKESAIGRKLSNGAPLTGNFERDIPDFDAEDTIGLKVIPEYAHIRRASAKTLNERFFRKPYNYQSELTVGNEQHSGMLWTAYAKDLQAQYVPVQKRLDEFDLLNLWTTPTGSSMWLIPGGFVHGRPIAEGLFPA